MLTAQDIMTADPKTIATSATVGEALQMLQTLEVRHLPVVDELGAVVGMLSDRDLQGVAFPRVIGVEYADTIQGALDTPVANVMSAGALTVGPEDEISVIVELMLDNRIGAVPVLDSDDTLVGIVSYVDLLRQMLVESPTAGKRSGRHLASRKAKSH